MTASRPRERLLRGEQFRELNVAEGSRAQAGAIAKRTFGQPTEPSSAERHQYRLERTVGACGTWLLDDGNAANSCRSGFSHARPQPLRSGP
jgi:hypothetical protein